MRASDKDNGNKKNSKSSTSKGLTDLFEDELKDIYWAEKALLKAMPKMMKKATSYELIAALENHVTQTEAQVERLERVFESVGIKAVAKKCEAMEGLIKEAEELMEDTEEGMTRDAAIISAAQKIEHYEIASYGTLRSFAQTLDHMDAVDLLEETLDVEKETDALLTEIAESSINMEAMEDDED
jgi:ferritin-like metal-binding protein YciE